jgi:hypothetical protein
VLRQRSDFGGTNDCIGYEQHHPDHRSHLWIGGLLSTTIYVNSSTLPQFQAGQCQPPSDLSADGTGVNLYWRNSVAKIAAHANGKDGNAGYLSTHAHITEWETWNEPSVVKFWRGTPGELIRMQEDLYALVKGYSASR